MPTRTSLFAPRRIAHATVNGPGRSLAILWEDGGESRIDLIPWIREKELTALLDPGRFRRVRVNGRGTGLEWEDGETAIDAGRLQLLEAAQLGVACLPEAMTRWRERNRLTPQEAATTLGVTRRTMLRYESGERPIPRTIVLACKGYESLRRLLAPAGAVQAGPGTVEAPRTGAAHVA